jgi:RNA polymerase sigma-70 factor, ECF subfamily
MDDQGLANITSDGLRADVEAQLPALNRFARRLVGPNGDADDLVQDTLLKALGASTQFETGTALKSWLFTIMRNTFCTAYRVRQREQVGIEDSLASMLSIPPAQEWAVRRSEMEIALERLPQHVRQALILISFGTSYDETARICHCEVGTVKSRVNRARKALVEDLGSLTMH